MVALVQPRFSIAFISSKEGWCGESKSVSGKVRNYIQLV